MKSKILNLIAKLNEKENYYLYLTLSLLISALYALIVFNKTFPLAEGWYSYYSQLINNGEVVYRDFEYLFFPFYINIIAFITKIAGYNIIVLRFIGVIIFLSLTYFAFKTFAKLFNPMIGMVASVVAVFYMQSEIVQVFYDYVRFMDLSVYISIFLLVNVISNLHDKNKNKAIVYSALSGISIGVFILIKQNMGILFWLYVVGMWVFFFIFDSSKKDIMKVCITFVVASSVFLFVSLCVFVGLSNFNNFFHLTLGGASSAKGGMTSILFNWLKSGNRPPIQTFLFKSSGLILFFIVNYIFTKIKPVDLTKLQKSILSGLFFAFAFGGIFFSFRYINIAMFFSNGKRISPWTLYIFALTVLAIAFVLIVLNFIKKKETPLLTKQIFAVGGCIFAIGYGCGTSGGLAEGQLGFALGFIIAVLLYVSKNKLNVATYSIVLAGCVIIILTSGSYKFAHPYSWWGLTEPDIWSATETTHVPKLKGIYVSENTKKILDTIYDTVQANSGPNDAIFTFPQISVFYTLTDRSDPGTYTKVQWFDVSMDEAVIQDIDVIKKTKPKIIITQDFPKLVVEAHESAFRGGEESGYSKMRSFLGGYVAENGYNYKRFKINEDHNITVYVKNDEVKVQKAVLNGEGTRQNPYLIDSMEQFFLFRDQVNMGRSFKGQYIKQIRDIDLSGIESWVPIGRFNSDNYFYGTYDGDGHVIENLSIKDSIDDKDANVGLFGTLGGKILNLGVEGDITGQCVGGITSSTIGKEAGIYNCYTDVNITAKRAGGIADNFIGTVANSFSVGKIDGILSADIVSNESSGTRLMNDYICSYFSPMKGIKNVGYVTPDFIKTEKFVDLLNTKLKDVNINNTDIGLLEWELGNSGYPQFSKRKIMTYLEFQVRDYLTLTQFIKK